MVYVDRTACEAAQFLFFGAGFWAALSAVYAIRSRQWKRLLWLTPLLLAGAWLESAFNPSVVRLELIDSTRAAIQYRQAGYDLLQWAITAVVFITFRNMPPLGVSRPPKPET